MGMPRSLPVALQCPQCGQIDTVQKVTSVVEAGYASTTMSGTSVGRGVNAGMAFGSGGGSATYGGTSFSVTNTTMSGATQSAVSQKLSPLGQPVPPTAWGVGPILGMIFGGVMLLCIGSFISYGIASAITGPTSTTTGGIAGFIDILLIGGYIALCITLIIGNQRSYRAKLAQYNANELPVWQRAMHRWSQLFFCARCDGVFLPGQTNLIPANQMHQYLSLPDQPVAVVNADSYRQIPPSSAY